MKNIWVVFLTMLAAGQGMQALADAPANDNFTNRITITGLTNTINASNVSATKETGEPDVAGNIGGHSVWWTWTVPTNGLPANAIASIDTFGSSFDTIMGVYVGNSVDGLSLITANDDDPNQSDHTSKVTFPVQAGETYQIVVDGYNFDQSTESGDIVLNLSVAAEVIETPPPNDNFNNSIVIPGTNTTIISSNLFATKEVGEPNVAGNSGGSSVWWTWTAVADADVTISTIGSSFDTILGVYTGDSVDNLTSVAENDDASTGGGPSSVTFTATGNTVYRIVVDGFNGKSGDIVLNVNQTVTPPVLPELPDQVIDEMAPAVITNSVVSSDIPAARLVYSLVSAPDGVSIDSDGVITWTPDESQGPSTNTIITMVEDMENSDINAVNTFNIIVREVNTAPQLPAQSDVTLDELTTLTVTNAATDSDLPANLLSYALLAAPGNASINADGVITWTPTEAQGPSTNVFTVVVTDTNPSAVNSQHLSATNSFTVIVNEVNVAPVLGSLPDRTANPGATVSFTATATDADLPANTLAFSLISPPGGATITSGGAFNWRPAIALAGTTNEVQVRVTDNGSPALSQTKSFNVIVNPLSSLSSVTLKPLDPTAGKFKMQVDGFNGPDYVIMASPDLAAWTDVFTNLSPAVPFLYTNDSSAGQRFYRVRLAP